MCNFFLLQTCSAQEHHKENLSLVMDCSPPTPDPSSMKLFHLMLNFHQVQNSACVDRACLLRKVLHVQMHSSAGT